MASTTLLSLRGKLDPVHVGLVSYMFLTSEMLSEAFLFRMLPEQHEEKLVGNRGYCAFIRNIQV